MKLGHRHSSTVVCMAVSCAALAGLAVPQAHAGEDALVTRVSLNPLHALDKASLTGFIDEPLFDPARRLPPPPPETAAIAQPVAAPPDPPPSVHLLGIIQGDLDLAVVVKDGETKTQILSSGDHLGAWNVTVLPSVGLRLRDGDRIVEYGLFDKGNASAEAIASTNNQVDVPPPPATMAERNARLQRRTY